MNVNARAMASRTFSFFLLATMAAGALGCSSNGDGTLSSHLTELRLAHRDADSIGSLDDGAAAPPTDLDDYRRPTAAATLKTVSIVRHPVR